MLIVSIRNATGDQPTDSVGRPSATTFGGPRSFCPYFVGAGFQPSILSPLLRAAVMAGLAGLSGLMRSFNRRADLLSAGLKGPPAAPGGAGSLAPLPQGQR